MKQIIMLRNAKYAVLTTAVLAVSIGFLFLSASAASSVTVTPIADTYASEAHPNDTHGSFNTVRTDGSPVRIAYLRFSVPNNASVSKATLRLYATEKNSKGYTAYTVASDWDSKTMTFNGRPTLGSKLGSSGGFEDDSWASVDVTAAVKASGTYSFALTANNSEQTEFSSSEASNNKPQLVIEFGSSEPSPAPSPTPAPTPSPGPSPASTPPPTSGASTPVRAAFYYPWFPGAWDQQGVKPYTQYLPSLGSYSSNDVNIIKQHIASMQYGHLDAGILSWWGQGSREDKVVPLDLKAATDTGFKWSLYYETEGYNNPSVQQIQNDLSYIKDKYASSPNYLLVNNKPVIFVYGDATDGCSMSDRWKRANATQGFYVVLKVFGGYAACGSQPDNWHQYSPAIAADHQSGHSYSISPGFFKKGEDSPRLTRDAKRWTQNIKDMVASKEMFQLATSFNEWGEGTSVELAQEWTSASGYGTYLDIMHANLPSGTVVAQPPVPADSQAPSTPATLVASLMTNNQVRLSWNTATDNIAVTGYNIYRDGVVIGSTNGVTLAFVDIASLAGNTYQYSVKAFDAAGNLSVDSNKVDVATATPPTTPTNLSAQVVSSTRIVLKWGASTDKVGVDHYNIVRNGVLIGTAPVGVLSYNDDNVLPGTAYKYAVSASNTVLLESVLSSSVVASTTAPTTTDTAPPSTPTNVKAIISTTNQVNVTWQAATDNVGIAGYTIFRNNTQLAQVNGNVTSFGDGTVVPSTTYNYTVKAFDAAKNTSPASTAASVTTVSDTTPVPPVVSGGPCGTVAQAPTTYKHVIWIWMENKTYTSVIGNGSAPYTTQLAASCATATKYQDAGSQYNSLSNYIAATAGVDSCTNGSCPATTWNDCNPSASCQAPIDNLFRQVRAIGTARSYQESMSANCALSGSGTYAPKHNPAAYFTAGTDRQACQTDNLPMGTTTSGAFHDALVSDGSLSTFSFVTPNLCNDTHDCSVQTGDNWLKGWLPLIFNSPAYKSGNTAVFVMYDEDTPTPNVFIAPSVKPGTLSSSAAIGHYATLRSTEEMLGITTYLGKANAAQSIRPIFNF